VERINKVIVRIRGGLGNQLFCYAAARRLSLVNEAELVIDNVSGFARDYEYRRKYTLDNFNIPVRKATPAERLEPFERYRRGVRKWLSRRKSFFVRNYIEQEGHDFDERLLVLKVNNTLYLDGLWQSESYFKDVEKTIREDLRIIPPTDALNQRMAEEIRNKYSVALHVRWFSSAGCSVTYNVSTDYYKRAIVLMEEKVALPHYFIFTDDPDAALAKLSFPENRVTFVSHNRGEINAYADLWLMTQCRHYIIANSTFSWWGAWFGVEKDKIVICPRASAAIATWAFKGQIPDNWLKM
jgi:Glycosyl transferase family 11